MAERVKGAKVRGGFAAEMMNKVWCEVEGGGGGEGVGSRFVSRRLCQRHQLDIGGAFVL